MARLDDPIATQYSTTDQRQGDFRWLIGMSAVQLLIMLPFSAYVASLPFIQAEWHMNNTQSGLVFSIYLIGYAISSLVLLPLTDQVPPRRILLAGAAVLVAANLLFPLLAYNYWIGAALRFIAGAGHVGSYITGVQLVSARFPGRRRGTAVGIFVSAGYAGTTLSYTFMGLLLSRAASWREAYLITALAGLIGLGLAFSLTRSPMTGPATSVGNRGRLDLTVLRDKAIVLVNLAYALHTAELYLARLWLPLLLGATLVAAGRAEAEAVALAATLSGFMFMMGIAGVLLGGYISDYLGRVPGAMLIFSLSGLCSFIAGWLVGAPPAWLIGLGFIYGFTTAADSAIYSTSAVELSPPGRVGSTQAVQSFVGFAIGAIMPVIAGSILDVVRSSAGWGLAFSFNGLLALVGLAGLWSLRRLPRAQALGGGKVRHGDESPG